MARIAFKPDNCIVALMYKHNICKKDLCAALKIAPKTYLNYLEDPYDIRLGDIVKMAALFGLTIPEFTYMLSRNKAKLTDNDNWYIQSLGINDVP